MSVESAGRNGNCRKVLEGMANARICQNAMEGRKVSQGGGSVRSTSTLRVCVTLGDHQ